MKALGLIFILAFTFCFTIMGQDNNSNIFKVGFKGGINVNGFTNEHTDLNTLFSGGIFSDFYFYKNLGVSAEINYIQRGGILRQILPKPNHINPNVDTFYEIDLYAQNNYLDLPLLFKYRVFISNDLTMLPTIGISYSIPLPFQEGSYIKNKKILENNDLPKFTGQYSDDNAETNTLLGLNIGSSLIYNKFIIELRYYRTFNEIKGAGNVEDLNYKIQSLQLLIGYAF
ncbi:MAG: PorT family protein [Ignavibacteriaceae bacterium]|nr:PorT family protein [Ignavibacterium sp.]MCC6254126.1 PorT family protein [Ignavibacteriaceae bacterium]HRN25478.1 porin family protein [Ignavibacteriaceae bacterium]HRP91260.1 porin family protein [Ignavibacteriaceae bacterium]HRQ52730.1 porin family protein [Ignavibacteriaceae bacterium]